MIPKSSTERLHPLTVKALKRGHPFITKDRFSDRFNKSALLIHGEDESGTFIGTLLHDPTHPDIKARFLSPDRIEGDHFAKLLSDRIESSITKREPPFSKWNRDNLYLLFGELDGVPGLFIQKFGNNLLIHLYAHTLFDWTDHILKSIHRLLPDIEMIAVQLRNKGQKNQFFFYDGKTLKQSEVDNKVFLIKEFGVNFEISFGPNYDQGIYTDMAQIRSSLFSLIEKSSAVLNLFSYTGAYSLHALRLKVPRVVSVDLSKKYLNWLDRNIEFNPELDKTAHQSIEGDVLKTLYELKKDKNEFSLIISDPPSSSSDGEGRSSALKDYERTLPLMLDLIPSKGHLVLFLNTHSINAAKFEAKIKSVIGERASIVKKLRLSGDCPTHPNFPEGDYLKGLVVRKG